MHTKRVDLDRCCVIVDKAEGVEELNHVVEQSGHRIELICTATIHDHLLREVRGWARMGYSKAAIQRELDFRFGTILSAVFMNAQNAPPETLTGRVDGTCAARLF